MAWNTCLKASFKRLKKENRPSVGNLIVVILKALFS
jgi:hypothetical protein